ncbi:EAL domain-containing protein [Microvirga lenta]|uniref:EAL domain-containing protein n=1 Tax=Microvirga lenta TaxID=2881337 RepID=UPI001CFE9514|nr:GGDEF domain-containing phosphodiesterase [Microvirga lenta]MCB5174318.1 EAL domain-containing protein [Microvirga lenta]
MATKRQGRAGLFNGVSRTSRRRPAPTGPQAALAALKGVVYSWDVASDAMTWGPNAPEVLGLPPGALPRTGYAFSKLVEPGSGPDHRDLAAQDGSEPSFDSRYALRFAPNRVLMVQDAGRWQLDADGRPCVLRGMLRIDPAASAQDLLPASIKARSLLLRHIQDNIDEAAQLSHTCTLMVGACDDDESVAMEQVARSLRPLLRRGDHVDILSPTRFAITLTCCPATEAMSAMRRASALVQAALPYAILHLGAACSPDHTYEAVKLLRFAEMALEAALSRSEPAVLHKTRHATKSKASDQSVCDLLAALNERRLVLALQPVVEAPSRQPALVQARAAMRGENGGISALGPVPAAETVNPALLIDGRMLELAADHLARHPEARLVLPVAQETLQDREWLPMLAAHLGARPGTASRLIVALPETILADAGEVVGPLNAMKALGLGIGLSGFGTGYASLASLRALPIDLATVDGVFVQTLKRSTDDRLFMRTLIDMAHHLGIAVAAEWVDDEASARLLAAWGVDYMQGDLFGAAEAAALPDSALKRLKRA